MTKSQIPNFVKTKNKKKSTNSKKPDFAKINSYKSNLIFETRAVFIDL